MLAPGVVLGGRYEIITRIGAGGMSDVYKAKDRMLNRFVAVKVLKAEFSADATFVKKFRVEAQSAAGLSHPNIVGVYDVGQENDTHYIVMELVQGITLKHYIARKGKLDIREALNIAIQVASGMGAAHANRIIHRDIKPQNIIMSRDGKVKVTDFGIAKAADSTTVTTNAAGSVHYISPEQARGGYSDEKSDIYSLGITLYEMVTGKVPYDGETNISVALQHIQGQMVPPRQIDPSIPRSVERIILKCTQKKPDLRYGSAKELIMDLRRALAEPDGNYVKLGAAAGAAAAAEGVGDSTTVVMNEADLKKLRNASGNGAAGGRTSDRPSSAAAKRRRQEEEAYEKYRRNNDNDDEDDDDVNPALDKTMMVFGIVGAVIIIVVIFFIIGRAAGLFNGIGSTTGTRSSRETTSISSEIGTIPDCVGKDQDEAIRMLEEAGFDYRVQEIEDGDAEKGEVIRQSPEANTRIEKGTTVTLFVCSGTESVELPDVKDMSVDEATELLEGMGLTVKTQEDFDDEIKEGDIIRTSPKAGSKVKTGQTVTIYVSKGSETKNATVPDLYKYGKEYAEIVLTERNLKLGNVSESHSNDVEAGLIIEQNPRAGTEVKEGTSVDVVVSSGPAETEPPETETPEAAQSSAILYWPSENPLGHDFKDGTPGYDSGTVTLWVDGAAQVSQYFNSFEEYNGGTWAADLSGTPGTTVNVSATIEGYTFATWTITF